MSLLTYECAGGLYIPKTTKALTILKVHWSDPKTRPHPAPVEPRSGGGGNKAITQLPFLWHKLQNSAVTGQKVIRAAGGS